MMTDHLGELAALGTSLAFSFSAILFTLAGRELGSRLVNRTRLLIALVFITILHWLTFGQLIPVEAGIDRWFWLGLSGFVGFTLGDSFLFQGFVMVGPRVSMLIMAFAPALSVILAWVFLGEVLTLRDLIIIAIVIAGIAWVVSERPAKSKTEEATPGDSRRHLIGILFAIGGAIGQAGGFILSKIGLAGDFPALSGTWIRILVAFISIWAVTVAQGGMRSSVDNLRAHPRALRFITIAAFIGPVLGVWLSLVAVQRSPVGIASTLSSLAPIFLLPISYFAFGEKISPRAIVGTAVVIVASALLFL
jgi:drug/metabolite transporter (DMT)-like permease